MIALRAFAFLLAAMIATMAAPANAQRNDPLGIAEAISEWFEKLDARWSKIASREELKQLYRRSGELSSAIYPVIRDTSALLDSIPDQRPNRDEITKLQSQIRIIDGDLENLREISLRVGPSIGMTNQEAQRLIDRSIVSRSMTLSYLRLAFSKALSAPENWQPDEMRRRLSASLERLSKAQLSLTIFRERLSKRLQA
jgi:hypothetical protein